MSRYAHRPNLFLLGLAAVLGMAFGGSALAKSATEIDAEVDAALATFKKEIGAADGLIGEAGGGVGVGVEVDIERAGACRVGGVGDANDTVDSVGAEGDGDACDVE